jgi:lactoylglutathione lyase
MKLTHVRLLVEEFDECFRFYRDVMGLAVQWGAEGSSYADFRSPRGEAMVALFSRRAMAETLPGTSVPCEMPCEDRFTLVFEATDLESTVSALKARGAQFILDITERRDWGIRTAHLRDPEGNLIELNSPLPQQQWSDELADEAHRYTVTGEAENARGGRGIGDTQTKQ